jgi:hypothetical protein
LLGLSGSAAALTPLYSPDPPGYSNLTLCAGIGFNPDGSVFGSCQFRQPSCGRYCQPAQVRWAVRWETDGTPSLIAQCGFTAQGLGRPPTTFLPPYNEFTCHTTFATGATVQVGASWFYYVSTDPSSGNELVNGQNRSYLTY